MSPLKVGQVVTATVRVCTSYGIYVSVAENPNASIMVHIDEIAWANPHWLNFLHGTPPLMRFPSIGEQIEILLLYEGNPNSWVASRKRLIKTLPTYNPQKYCIGSIHKAVMCVQPSFEYGDGLCLFIVEDGLTFHLMIIRSEDVDGMVKGDSALIEVTEDIYNLEEWFRGNTCRFIQRITSEERGFPIAWRPKG